MGIVNLQWRIAMTKAGREFNGTEQDDGWPQAMTPAQLAALQKPFVKGDRAGLAECKAIYSQLVADSESGKLSYSTGLRKTRHQITRQIPGDARFATRNIYGEREIQPRQELAWASKEVEAVYINASSFATWLAAQRPLAETPSIHIAAWFDEIGLTSATMAQHEPMPANDNPALAALPIQQRQDTRLARLRALGGDRVYRKGKWSTTGNGSLKQLVAELKSNSDRPNDEKMVRNDLTAAAERELQSKRAGHFAGLGAR